MCNSIHSYQIPERLTAHTLPLPCGESMKKKPKMVSTILADIVGLNIGRALSSLHHCQCRVYILA